MEEGDKISSHIDIENIKKIVFFVSLSEQIDKVIDESTIFKSLRIFDSLEKIFLIYTEETEEKFFELKNELHFHKKEVIGIKVNIDKIENVYVELKKLSIDEQISSEDTLIDITLGPKIVGISFYKLAVERGLKAINWKTSEIMKYSMENGKIIKDEKKGNKRFSFASSLEIMIEPKNENYKTYQNINESIKNYNFSATAMLYSQLGDKNMSKFYNELSNFFSLKIFYGKNNNDWEQELIRFFKKINENVNPTIGLIEKVNGFLTNYFSIIYDKIEDEKWTIEFMKKFKINSEAFISDFEGEYSNVLSYIGIKYLIHSFGYNSTDIINKMFSLDLIDAEGSDEDLYYEFNENFEGNVQLLTNFIPETLLYEKLKKSFSFKNGILEIDRYSFEENLNEKFKDNEDLKVFFKNSSRAKILRKVLEDGTHKVSGLELIGMFYPDHHTTGFDEDKMKSCRKNITDTKNLMMKFNDELKRLNHNIKDLIIYEKDEEIQNLSQVGDNSNLSKVKYHSFLINPKYLEI
ncbi:MAG: hypothetical protein ACRC5T_02335 [Cetobacterium sp.]